MAAGIPARLSASAQGRKFGLTIGSAFAVLGAVAWWRNHHEVATTLAALSGAGLLAALFVPAQLVPVERAWLRLALAISRITTPILMGAVFFLVITPVGVVRRVFGKGPLKRSAGSETHWVSRGPGARRSDLARQF